MVGVDFILNVIVDEHQRIVDAAAGDVVLAHGSWPSAWPGRV